MRWAWLMDEAMRLERDLTESSHMLAREARWEEIVVVQAQEKAKGSLDPTWYLIALQLRAREGFFMYGQHNVRKDYSNE